MVIAPLAAQIAVPLAVQAVSKVFSHFNAGEQPAVAAPTPTDPATQQLQAQATGKGFKINVFA